MLVGSPSVQTLKKLFALSGNQCAFPKCKAPLVTSDGAFPAEVCHIRGQKPGAARYDESQPEVERHSASNLIVLCPNHHTVVDDDEVSYTVERLTSMKAEHEARTSRAEPPSDEMTDRFVFNVTSNNQSGGVTAGVYVNQAPKPTCRVTQLVANQPMAEGFGTRFQIDVESPYPANALEVEVRAPSLVRIALMPVRSGPHMFQLAWGQLPGGGRSCMLQHPYGAHYLDVITARPETCDLRYRLT